MAKTISIGAQDFAALREQQYFYIDKTGFIRDWWMSGDVVTLITRPRRFGKTLNMSMLECFFSNKYAGQGEKLFGDLEIWKDEKLRAEQGQWPVIFLSFAGVKNKTFHETREAINKLIADKYDEFRKLLGYEEFSSAEKESFDAVNRKMDDVTAMFSINTLCGYLERHYGKKPIILLDEYDTPMQEAWINDYWDDLIQYIRVLFNNTFKTNPHLYRAVMTGITRVSKESIFSDLNNLEVVTTTSKKYMTAFGFTEDEVFTAMDDQGFPQEKKKDVKFWYDGFTFGTMTDIYNPLSRKEVPDQGL